jgi:hypothetical protein
VTARRSRENNDEFVPCFSPFFSELPSEESEMDFSTTEEDVKTYLRFNEGPRYEEV